MYGYPASAYSVLVVCLHWYFVDHDRQGGLDPQLVVPREPGSVLKRTAPPGGIRDC